MFRINYYFGISIRIALTANMDDFLNILREKAIYFRLSSGAKYGGAVSVDDILKVLGSLKDSYYSFVEAEYLKLNIQQDKKILNRVLKSLLSENKLVVVDLKFDSYGMFVSPNTITNVEKIPQIKAQQLWKKETFESYKNIVLNSDFDNNEYLKEVERKYTPEQRNRIFKPIIEGIAKNPNAKTSFQLSLKDKPKSIQEPKKKGYSVLMPEIPKEKVEPVEIKTLLAKVEIKEGRTIPKILELFNNVENPVITYTEFGINDKEYKLDLPLYCELIHNEEGYFLENKALGIYSSGISLEEAQNDFYVEFDYIFSRYNELPDDELSDDVLKIKKLLNLSVAK